MRSALPSSRRAGSSSSTSGAEAPRAVRPQEPAAHRHAHAAGGTVGAVDEHLPALAARHGRLFRRALCADATVGRAVSWVVGPVAGGHWPDLGSLWPPPCDDRRDGPVPPVVVMLAAPSLAPQEAAVVLTVWL